MAATFRSIDRDVRIHRKWLQSKDTGFLAEGGSADWWESYICRPDCSRTENHTDIFEEKPDCKLVMKQMQTHLQRAIRYRCSILEAFLSLVIFWLSFTPSKLDCTRSCLIRLPLQRVIHGLGLSIVATRPTTSSI